MIRVALIHPSRGRPGLAAKAYNEWVDLADKPDQIEYILVLDDDDPTLEQYQLEIKNLQQTKVERFVHSIGDTRNLIQAVNRGATFLSETTELIVGVSDDMGSLKGWDTALFSVMGEADNFKVPKFVGVSDGLHGFGTMLNQIVNRAWYTRLGYLLYPEYDGVCADNDMVEVSRRLNCIVSAPHIQFEHRHPIAHKAPWDATYARHNTAEGTARNTRLLEERRKRNFDV